MSAKGIPRTLVSRDLGTDSLRTKLAARAVGQKSERRLRPRVFFFFVFHTFVIVQFSVFIKCMHFVFFSFQAEAIPDSRPPLRKHKLDTLQRGVQWMGGAADGGSIM